MQAKRVRRFDTLNQRVFLIFWSVAVCGWSVVGIWPQFSGIFEGFLRQPGP
jgi:hypothetical protein